MAHVSQVTAVAEIPGDVLEQALRRGYVAAYRWLGNAAESNDACQEAARRALSTSTFDPTQPFYPWFYRILKNHCFDRLSRRRRDGALREPSRTPPPNAEQALLQTERDRAVAAAVAELPPELAEMIELRHFQDLSYEEMAAIAGCPTGTVMSRLYRARKRLRELLLATPTFGGAA